MEEFLHVLTVVAILQIDAVSIRQSEHCHARLLARPFTFLARFNDFDSFDALSMRAAVSMVEIEPFCNCDLIALTGVGDHNTFRFESVTNFAEAAFPFFIVSFTPTAETKLLVISLSPSLFATVVADGAD